VSPGALGLGGRIDWQSAVLDPSVTGPIQITHDTALRTTIGGSQQS
jgi:hypothetical protein